MNKNIIKEVLELLRDYSGWMYYAPNAAELLKASTIEESGYKCHLGLTPEGLMELTIENFPDIKAVYDCQIVTVPLEEGRGIENTEFKVRVVTPKEEIPEDFHEFFDKMASFASSYFQRAVAFQFFCRMQSSTIEMMAKDLEKLSQFKKEEKAKSE